MFPSHLDTSNARALTIRTSVTRNPERYDVATATRRRRTRRWGRNPI